MNEEVTHVNYEIYKSVCDQLADLRRRVLEFESFLDNEEDEYWLKQFREQFNLK